MSSISLHFPPKATLVASARSKPPAPLNADPLRISFPPFQGIKDWLRSSGTKAKAQLSQAVAEKSENSAPVVEKEERKLADAETVSSFMSQVSNLVRMVDSSDITELQLRQLDCEIVIRKKEALQQPPPPPAPVASFPSYPQFAPPPPPPAPAAAAASPAPAPAPAAAAPPPASKSSHPPFKCPMPGTFYRASAPGAAPFVKVGDKVQKGQVLCIVEAMKLMNEIESDQAGTITEILVENGSPVSVDTPLFIIEP